MAQHTGTVAWFNNAKGYGFLSYAGGPDVFVHYSAILMQGYHSLKEGQPVEFDIIQGEKGPQADQVVRLDDEPSGVEVEGEPSPNLYGRDVTPWQRPVGRF